MPTLAVITFPGNNCETETLRAAARNGFEAKLIRWNEPKKVQGFDVYVLPGGFSFEDRGRSGVIASREPIFNAIREEAKRGKLILGICNGAQMIVESGLIPINGNPLPFGIARNLRTDKSGHIIGKGFYNTWVDLTPIRKDTAFTTVGRNLHIPMAHGEGRFISEKNTKELEGDEYVAYRYSKNPNGTTAGVAAIVNKEGTIMAIMPHPERFYKEFDGDEIFQSMRKWIEAGKSPSSVEIGSLSGAELEIPTTKQAQGVVLEKRLIITDNEAFSVSQAVGSILGVPLQLKKSIRYEVSGEKITKQDLLDTGLFLNPNKEVEIKSHVGPILAFQEVGDEAAAQLEERLSHLLNIECKVYISKVWEFPMEAEAQAEKILHNGLLANPNASLLVQEL